MTPDQAIKTFGQDLSLKIITCIVLVGVADFLFYKEQLGWTVGGFASLLFLCTLAINISVLRKPVAKVLSLGACGLVLALIYDPSFFTAEIFILTMVGLALLARNQEAQAFGQFCLAGFVHHLLGWRLFFTDLTTLLRSIKKRHKHRYTRPSVKLVLPLVFSGAFVMLFASANPILASIIEKLDPFYLFRALSLARSLFWLSVAAICWGFIRPRFNNPIAKQHKAVVGTDWAHTLSTLLDRHSILVSLIAFNIIFFVQNALDITFLWSGADLPEGISRARYAQQGAYPLIFTSLLAAAYVLIAFRPQCTLTNARLLRTMVSVWVGQNVFLVASSIYRLLGYIEEYSLTYMRVTAFVWMGLVALGLILILARIYRNKSNLWLIKSNLLMAYLTLYICCFINFGSMIAFYNVHHARGITGHGASLDCRYLWQTIGAEALPAIIWYMQNDTQFTSCGTEWVDGYKMEISIPQKLQKLEGSLYDWRHWTPRKQRLLDTIKLQYPNFELKTLKTGGP